VKERELDCGATGDFYPNDLLLLADSILRTFPRHEGTERTARARIVARHLIAAASDMLEKGL
jgi:hypothetical protein